MTLALKPDEAFNPVHISLLGADAVMLHAQAVTYLIKQFRRRSSEVFLFRIFGCYHFLNPLRTLTIYTMREIIHLEGVFTSRISGVYF